MKKEFILGLFLAIATCFLTACKEDTPQPVGPEPPTPPVAEYEVLSEGPFLVEFKDLHASYCTLHVKPETLADHAVWYGITTEDYFFQFGSREDILTTTTNYINAVIDSNIDKPISELVEYGEFEREVKGLLPKSRIVAFACHVDEAGSITSGVQLISTTTPEVRPSANRFTLKVSDVTATNAILDIKTTNSDHYVWMEIPTTYVKDFSESELQDFLMKHYAPFFAIRTHSGDLTYDFEDALDPDTEYMIIVFGYDGDMTTALTTTTFTTGSPGAAEEVTFEVEYSELTSRSVRVTIIPSDPSVSYLAIVADEVLLESYGGATAEGVKTLLDEYIEQTIASGECDDRVEFANYYTQHGTRTGTFSLLPGYRHYTCIVAVDGRGNFASEVKIDGFDAPGNSQTNASVSIRYEDWFDGDMLALLDAERYGEYAGKALLPVEFSLEGSAVVAIYTLFDRATLEQEQATEADILDSLLNDELLGVYNFYTEPRVDLALEWDTEYCLYAVAMDYEENISRLIQIDIPALSRADAAPYEEFRPQDGSELPSGVTIKATYGDYFDGSALADLDPERYGRFDFWAVFPIEFTLGVLADKAVYMYLDEYNMGDVRNDQHALDLLTDLQNIGELTNWAQGRTDLRLEWGVSYRLYMVALDEAGEPGELVKIDLEPLDPEKVKPIEEYIPY